MDLTSTGLGPNEPTVFKKKGKKKEKRASQQVKVRLDAGGRVMEIKLEYVQLLKRLKVENV